VCQVKEKLKRAKNVLYVDAHQNVKIPNLALMKLSHYLRLDFDYADGTIIKRLPDKKLFGDYDIVFVSCIFQYKFDDIVKQIKDKGWEHKTIIGGYGSPYTHKLEDLIGEKADIYDFSLYPWFEPNIGFSQRGCRGRCDFCVVPTNEGKNHSVNSLKGLLQKPTNKLVLLDNDFFGQRNWKEKAEYILANELKVSFNQGINVRLLKEEQAEFLVKINPYSFTFKQRLLNTAWDQLKDEKLFRKRLEMLLSKGYKPDCIMVYMLIGFEEKETFDTIWYRFWTLQKYNVFPYPMVYIHPVPNLLSKGLKLFRQWVTYYAKDRFIKHNTGKVNERAYYKDFKEFFEGAGKDLPREIHNYFQVDKFKTTKFDKKPTKRIRAEEREQMTSLWNHENSE
jgi:hypothetical protein